MPFDSTATPGPADSAPAELVRVKIADEDPSFETIKTAIYAQAKYFYEHKQLFSRLLLSQDLFEILNRRLVFKTAAHKDAPHFITPFGNLEVHAMGADLDEALSFIIE